MKNENEIKIALVSQPNVGKTTLFNSLTKSRAYVANWPGKTVQRMEGRFEFEGRKIRIIDLPGIRSLNALSEEEKLSKDFILSKKEYDVLIVLVDAETIEKTLYFAIQILEFTSNVVIAINKYDKANNLGLHLNKEGLEKALGVPVVFISALKNINIDELIQKSLQVAEGKQKTKTLRIDYGSLEEEISKLEKQLFEIEKENRRIAAIRILEGDDFFIKNLKNKKKILKEVKRIKENFEKKTIRCEEKIVIQRYNFVSKILKENAVYVKVAQKKFVKNFDKLILGNFFFGFTFSILILFFVIFISFSINTGFPLNYILRFFGYEQISKFVEENSLSSLLIKFFDLLSKNLQVFLYSLNFPEWFIDLATNGIMNGIAAVLSFFPLIFIVNFLMGIVEDSGLMARSAVVFHRLTEKLNLSGRAIFPATMSLACNVPGILSTRILENEKQRKAVAVSLPFIVCQARLVVLIFLASVFFTSKIFQSLVVVFSYAFSFFLFFASYLFVSKFILKLNEKIELIEELPSFHFPSLRVVWWISWERSKSFLTKAGVVIFPMAIFIWFLLHFGASGYVQEPSLSFGKQFGELFGKMFYIQGFDDWRLSLSLLTGFFAKEVLIETLAISFNTTNIQSKISSLISKPSALSFITFAMLYTPCIASIAAINLETKSKKMVALSIAISFLLAYLASLFVYFVSVPFLK